MASSKVPKTSPSVLAQAGPRPVLPRLPSAVQTPTLDKLPVHPARPASVSVFAENLFA
jgi:hypothetical protein